LTKVIPVYEKVNRYISLGTDIKIRREGISLLIESLKSSGAGRNFLILDAGSGPGKMTELYFEESPPNESSVVQFDALLPMLKASQRKKPSADRILGIYEQTPFQAKFDAVMAGFAIRDARNLRQALQQLRGCLMERGYFLIVDLSKPDSKTKRSLIGLYWRLFSPLLASLASPKLGRKFAALHTTFRKLPSNSEQADLLKESGFEIWRKKEHMFGGSSVILLRKS
jgi:demethylmenaquinone methyltransferase / 2-methoxy-6-polyprenyl-1,4-benzoquinol methylase